MTIGQNWPKIGRKLKVVPRKQILHQKGKEIFKMSKKSQFSAKILRFLAVLTKKTHKKWAKK